MLVRGSKSAGRRSCLARLSVQHGSLLHECGSTFCILTSEKEMDVVRSRAVGEEVDVIRHPQQRFTNNVDCPENSNDDCRVLIVDF